MSHHLEHNGSVWREEKETTPVGDSSRRDSQVDFYGQTSTHIADTQMGGLRP